MHFEWYEIGMAILTILVAVFALATGVPLALPWTVPLP